MMDFIVVGGGLSGMWVARELSGAGARVALLERGELGKEASWAGGGILSPLYPWRYADAVTALSLWSQRHLSRCAGELAEETGIDPEWLQSGLLIAEQIEAANAAEWARRHDVTIQTLSGEQLQEMEPGLASLRDGGGMCLPEVAQIRNPRLLKALARSLALRGVTIKSHSEVVALVEQGDRVQGVRTHTETLLAGGVIVTAGAWTADLLGSLAADWQIVPVRGQMLLFHAAPGQVRHIVLQGGHYLVPRRDGRVLAGSTMEYVGFDKSTTPQAYDELHAAAVALIPALAQCPVEQHWAGLRPGSAQGIPLIGPHPQRRGLYVNAGHFRNGVVTGPASARLLADLIFGRKPCVDPAPYSVPTA
jgi:glycine oxidase